ncbi:MAG: hypothetical protein ACO3A2_08660 [Bdellovibrionia bacterium]
MPLLTSENYTQGFLVDDDLMAGVTTDPGDPSTFMAFVLRHSTGEYLGVRPCPSLEEALAQINQIPRSWSFEPLKAGCGGGGCGKKGGCAGGGCKSGACGKSKNPSQLV